MLNFICTSSACLAQVLGVGSVLANDGTTLLYTNFTHTYVCKVQAPIYSCTKLMPKVSTTVDLPPDDALIRSLETAEPQK